jgi:hypothetical protein
LKFSGKIIYRDESGDIKVSVADGVVDQEGESTTPANRSIFSDKVIPLETGLF